MTETKPTLQPIEAEEEIVGYGWHQNKGSRVVIVVDDRFQVPEFLEYKDQMAQEKTMISLWKEISAWERTQAMGFFMLPSPKTIEEKAEIIINTIKEWVGTFNSDRCKFYLLVDFYYGNTATDALEQSGPRFVDRWMRYPPFDADVAYLSIAAGHTGFQDPHNLKQFSKYEIKPYDNIKSGKIGTALEKWLEYVEHPLEKVWRLAQGWFLNDEDRDCPLIKHNFAAISKYFSGVDEGCNTQDGTENYATQYRHEIEATLGIQCPDSWWHDSASVGHIHEALKHLCGAVFCGQTDDGGGRNVSVGAAYLIALMAHQHCCGNTNVLTQKIPSWKDLEDADCEIFPAQHQGRAKASAMALYDVFYRAFEKPGSENESQVKTAFFKGSGRRLEIQLWWNATLPTPGKKDTLAQKLSETLNSQMIKIPETEGENPSASKTLHAILRLWRSMTLSDQGFMGPGVFYWKGDTLVLAAI